MNHFPLPPPFFLQQVSLTHANRPLTPEAFALEKKENQQNWMVLKQIGRTSIYDDLAKGLIYRHTKERTDYLEDVPNMLRRWRNENLAFVQAKAFGFNVPQENFGYLSIQQVNATTIDIDILFATQKLADENIFEITHTSEGKLSPSSHARKIRQQAATESLVVAALLEDNDRVAGNMCVLKKPRPGQRIFALGHFDLEEAFSGDPLETYQQKAQKSFHAAPNLSLAREKIEVAKANFINNWPNLSKQCAADINVFYEYDAALARVRNTFKKLPKNT